MKKFLKLFSYSLLAIILAGFTGLYIYYHSFSAEQDNIEINSDNLKYFHESYNKSRQAFLTAVHEAGRKFNNIELSEFRVSSNVDTNLIMDLCYIPPQQDTNRLLVLISGTHGIEGYTGSAIQQMFLNDILNEEIANDMAILLIHAYNPYGFKYYRKATEFNVDLNRNCGTDNSIFENKNPGYGDLYDLLCPAGKVNTGNPKNQFFYLVAIWNILKESMATLRQAALQGQYEFPEGIYYGGNDFTPQTNYLKKTLPKIFEQYDLIFAVDLHTGYGEWAKLHLFPNPEKDDYVRTATESLFEGYHIDWGDSDDFYTIMGDLSKYLQKVNPQALTLCMPFEFGTLNSQETFGSLVSIHRMILENQGYNNGYKNHRNEIKVKNDFKEMYYPSSEIWRSEVIRQSREMLELSIGHFKDIELED